MKKFVVKINISCDIQIHANDKDEAEYIATDMGTIQIDNNIIYPEIKEIRGTEDTNLYKN